MNRLLAWGLILGLVAAMGCSSNGSGQETTGGGSGNSGAGGASGGSVGSGGSLADASSEGSTGTDGLCESAHALSWRARAPLPAGRWDLGAATVNGKVYAIGGNSGSATAEVDEYDPVADRWTPKRSMPTARQNAVVTAVQNKIYVIAGYAYSDPNQVTYFTSNEVYDPATDTWATKAPIPAPAPINSVLSNLFLGGNSVGDKIYVAVSEYAKTDDTLVYDTVADSWSSLPPLVLSGTTPKAAAIGDTLYVVATQTWGIGYENRMAQLAPKVTPPWTTHAGPPTHRAAEAVVSSSNVLFVLGGWNWVPVDQPTNATGVVDAYDAKKDAWTTLESAPTPRAAAAAAVAGQGLYFIGGGVDSRSAPLAVDTVEEATCAP